MPKRKTGHRLVHVRISAAQHDNLTAESEEQAETMSTIIRAAIRHYLANTDLTIAPEDRLPQ